MNFALRFVRAFDRPGLATLVAGLSLLLLTPLGAQPANPVWTDISEGAMLSARAGAGAPARRTVAPRAYRTLQLDPAALGTALRAAPRESAVATAAAPTELALPLPDGSFARVTVEDSPIMADDLARRYPDIKTYLVRGIDDPLIHGRLDRTPQGFHAMLFTRSGTVFIDPYWRDDTSTYLAYRKSDFATADKELTCLTASEDLPPVLRALLAPRPTGGTLRTYRLAVACTGEYATAAGGGTVNGALGAIITTVNRVSAVYERDLAIRLRLIDGSDRLIFLDPATDGFTNNSGGTLLSENQSKIDTIIGNANYDIGHVFSTGGGGVAGLGVVGRTGLKARGVTGSSNPVGDPFDIDYVAHEMGHQFGGNHPFNGNSGACAGGNRSANSAYEPGSGTTIMAYAGICSPQDLAPNSDDYFHTVNYDEIDTYTSGSSPGNVGTPTATGNTPPSIGSLASYTIPMQTPFALTASATDVDGDVLTYAWEQFDRGAAQDPTAAPRDNGASPLFRSFDPSPSPTRLFPSLTYILNNANVPPATIGSVISGEFLPTTNRTMTFRVTVRDNRAGGGGSNYASTTVTATTSAGPFAISAFNTATTIAAGSTQTITWSVANTTAAPVNCANVKISLSTDGGQTFPFVLAASTPNDGSEVVTIPSVASVATTQARFKIEAVGNIFFDLSDANTTITSSNTAPSLAITGSVTVRRGTLTAVTAQVGTVSDSNTPLTATILNAPADTTITATISGSALNITARADSSLVTTNTTRTYPVTVVVTDSLGATTSGPFNLIVQPNLTPTLGNYANRSVSAGASATLFPTASPADGNGNLGATPLSVSPGELPGGGTVTVHQATGAVTVLTTGNTTPGTYLVRVTLQDLSGAATVRSFNLTVGSAAALPVWVGQYDPTLSTLPNAQGWVLGGTSTLSPAPTFVDGALHQGPTSTAGFQYWETNLPPADFATSAGRVMEITLRVVSSSYGPGSIADTWRAGYFLSFGDASQRFASVGISDTGVRISNTPNLLNANSSAFVTVDTTSVFRTYRLAASSEGLVLSVDGVVVATLPLGATGNPGSPNYAFFADGSSSGASETYLRTLHWGAFSSVSGTAPVFTSTTPPGGRRNAAYSHTFTASGSPAPSFAVTAGTLPPGLTLTGATLSGTPTTAGTFSGITVTASNGVAPNATQTFAIVIATGAEPTLSAVSTLAGAQEDTSFPITYGTFAAAADEADADGDPIAFRVEAVSSGTLTKNGNAVVPGTTLLGSGESWVWTPAANANGAALNAFTVKAWDGIYASASAVQVRAAVAAVNDAPSFTKGANQIVAEDSGAQSTAGWATALSAGPADESGQALDFFVSNDNPALFAAGPAISPAGTLSFTPAANANGSANVTVRLHDNGGTASGGIDTSAAQTFTLTVSAVNDTPTISDIAAQTVPMNGSTGAIAFTVGDVETAAGSLTLTVASSNTTLVPVANVGFGGSGANRTVTVTPATGQGGIATITVTVSDGSASASDSFDVTVQSAGTLQFSAASFSALENAGSATITVTRTGGSLGAVAVNYATSNGTATAGSDYTATAGTLNWSSGDAAPKSFTIALTDDSTSEANETIALALSTATGGATLGSPASATLTIVDNDGDAFATHAVVGPGYIPGGTVTITNTITYTGSGAALGWQVLVPEGWMFVSDGGAAGDIKPDVGQPGSLEWGWTSIPASPVTFTYTLSVPANETAERNLSALAIVRRAGSLSAIQVLAHPEPLPVPRVTAHTGDSDANFRFSLIELTRVIELYNTRNGSTRTGAYQVATVTTEDGFAPDPARAANASVTLTRYHSADTSPRDGKLNLIELTRVIELYNYRSGSTRTGQYHIQSGTEDGYAPGP